MINRLVCHGLVALQAVACLCSIDSMELLLAPLDFASRGLAAISERIKQLKSKRSKGKMTKEEKVRSDNFGVKICFFRICLVFRLFCRYYLVSPFPHRFSLYSLAALRSHF